MKKKNNSRISKAETPNNENVPIVDYLDCETSSSIQQPVSKLETKLVSKDINQINKLPTWHRGNLFVLVSVFLVMLFVPMFNILPLLSSKKIIHFYIENWKTLLLPALFPFIILSIFCLLKSSRKKGILVGVVSVYLALGATLALFFMLINFVFFVFSILACVSFSFILTIVDSKAGKNMGNTCVNPDMLISGISGMDQAFILSFFIVIIYGFIRLVTRYKEIK